MKTDARISRYENLFVWGREEGPCTDECRYTNHAHSGRPYKEEDCTAFITHRLLCDVLDGIAELKEMLRERGE